MGNPSQAPASGATGVSARGAGQAVLVVDGTGNILTADAGARSLWRAGETGLAGERLPALFAFEVTSTDAQFLESQWEVLLATATAAPLRLTAQPKEGEKLEVFLQLEKTTLSSAPAYLAFVQPAGAPSPSSGRDLGAMLADNSPVGVFDLNFKAGTYYYSPAWKKQLGYADHELAATFETWRTLLHPEDSAAAPDRVSSKSSNGVRSFSAEYRLRHKRGHYVWLHSTGIQALGPGGKIERVAGVHIDITERKEVEDESLQSEERLRKLSSPGPLGAFDFDFAAGRHWISPAWKRLLGYSPDELADGPDALADALHPDDSPAGLKEFFLAKFPGQPAWVDLCRLRHKDGMYLWALGGVVRHVSRKRELLRVTGFHIILPAELPAVGDRVIPLSLLAGAFAEIREGVVVADPAGRITYANDKAAQLLRQTPDELRGRPVAEAMSLVRRSSGQPAEFPVTRLLELGETVPLNNDFSLSRAEGTPPAPLVFSGRPVSDPGGRPVGVVIVFRNPEEMTLTPEELIRSNRFESLGELAGGIAHDFNNLLTTILGGISLAKENRDYSRIEDSEQACMAAKGLTKQLLTFAKGGTSVQTVLAPTTLLKETARVAAAGASTEVTVEVAPSTGNILGDRAQLLQVFQNLVVNAIQAMPAGRPGHVWIRAANATLAADQVPPLSAGEYVQFEVRDDGCGIPPEILRKIFDAFFTTKKHGTGLGLATVMQVVRRHGGHVGVESTVGTGTTFTIFLPRAEQPVAVEARRAPTLRFGTGRILLMDDDDKICELTSGMLDSLEYKYDVVKKGEEAIVLYKRYLNIGRPYDAVIMDLTIVGGMGGEETFKKLHELDPDVRAIVSSGYDSDEMAKQFLDLGFCGYLTKPYRLTDLGRMLKEILG
jgi:PAS domain S-box-containing protein